VVEVVAGDVDIEMAMIVAVTGAIVTLTTGRSDGRKTVPVGSRMIVDTTEDVDVETTEDPATMTGIGNGRRRMSTRNLL
jgi:hypothetical protein